MPFLRFSAACSKILVPTVALAGVVSAAVGVDFAASLVRKRVMRVKRGGVPVAVVSMGSEGSSQIVSLGDSSLSDHPGTIVLWSDDKSQCVLLGPVLRRGGEATVRTVLGDWPVGMIGMTSGFLYGHVGQTPSDFALRFQDIEVNGKAAWLVPANGAHVDSHTWVIHVHGLGGGRNQTLRGLPVFAHTGFTSLVPSFEISIDRGSDHGRYGSFGVQEMETLVAAHDFAVSNGATSIFFVGWSYGALAVARTLARNRWKDIQGCVLVSPALDWRQIVFLGLSQVPIPAVVRSLLLARINSPIARKSADKDDWAGIAEDVNLALTKWPTLITHGTNDTVVPYLASVELGALYSNTVTAHTFLGAHHGMEWNSNEGMWDSVIADWVEALAAET